MTSSCIVNHLNGMLAERNDDGEKPTETQFRRGHSA